MASKKAKERTLAFVETEGGPFILLPLEHKKSWNGAGDGDYDKAEKLVASIGVLPVGTGQALILGAKAHALLSGRHAVAPQDVRRVLLPVLRHRVLVNYSAEAEGITPEKVVEALLAHVSEPRSGINL